MDCYFFRQGIFPIQGLNPRLLLWQADSLPLSHQRSPMDYLVLLKRFIQVGFINLNSQQMQSMERRGCQTPELAQCGGGGDGLVGTSCPTLRTPWTAAPQAPLSMGFSRQEYWSGLLFPSPGDLPNPGIKPRSPALQADS